MCLTKLKSRAILLVFLLSCLSLYADKVYNDTITDFSIVRVRDGDTFIINIENIPDVFGKEISVRIRGIDTPELKDKRPEIKEKALKARDVLEELLSKGNITLYNIGRDKYFRLLASVKVGEIDVATYMIQKGHAKKYNGGKKESF